MIDEDVEIQRFNAKNQNTPIVRLLGHSNMVLPSSIRLPPLIGGKGRVQKITYVGLPNQCFKCRQIGHMAKDCTWQNEPRGNSNEKIKQTWAIEGEGDWTMVRKGKGFSAKNVNLSNKWMPTRNRFEPIGNLEQSLPRDAILVEEVDGASFTKHKTNMDHIIDHDLSSSSKNIGATNLLDSLVHDDEGLGIKGDQNLPLVVYVEKDGRTIL